MTDFVLTTFIFGIISHISKISTFNTIKMLIRILIMVGETIPIPAHSPTSTVAATWIPRGESIAADPSRNSLVTLPTELRLIIYNHVFPTHPKTITTLHYTVLAATIPKRLILQLTEHGSAIGCAPGPDEVLALPMALMLSCRKIYGELVHHVYAHADGFEVRVCTHNDAAFECPTVVPDCF